LAGRELDRRRMDEDKSEAKPILPRIARSGLGNSATRRIWNPEDLASGRLLQADQACAKPCFTGCCYNRSCRIVRCIAFFLHPFANPERPNTRKGKAYL
jgi:hypothetical protein